MEVGPRLRPRDCVWCFLELLVATRSKRSCFLIRFLQGPWAVKSLRPRCFSLNKQTISTITLLASNVKTDNLQFVDVPHWIRSIKARKSNLR